MPELPEVETVRRGLEPVLVGRRVERFLVLDPRLVQPASPLDVEAQVGRHAVAAVERRGKYLLWRLDDGQVAVWHLRMTGSFLVVPQLDEPDVAGWPERTRAVAVLAADHAAGTGTSAVCFLDVRRFGTLDLQPDAAAAASFLDQRLGPEPLGDDFTPTWLATRLRGRHAAVKAVLLDQRVVAGLGNIYADEALFQAGVHPERPADRVPRRSVEALHAAIRDRLAAGIAAQGSTLRDHRQVDGSYGSMQSDLRVYGRAGEPCATCGAELRRSTVGGRTSTWCATCQPRSGRTVCP